MDIMRRAEKAGLVHETINIQDTSAFICNCCPCCCGFLKSVKELRNYGAIAKSNFAPKIDRNLCTLCEKCMEICPMEAIYHHWPHSDNLSDDMMVIRGKTSASAASSAPPTAPTKQSHWKKLETWHPSKPKPKWNKKSGKKNPLTQSTRHTSKTTSKNNHIIV